MIIIYTYVTTKHKRPDFNLNYMIDTPVTFPAVLENIPIIPPEKNLYSVSHIKQNYIHYQSHRKCKYCKIYLARNTLNGLEVVGIFNPPAALSKYSCLDPGHQCSPFSSAELKAWAVAQFGPTIDPIN